MRFSAFWVCPRHDFALSKLMIFPTRANFAMKSEQRCGKFCRARLAGWRRCWAGIAPIGAKPSIDEMIPECLTAPVSRICEATFECRICDTEMLTRFLTRLIKLAQGSLLAKQFDAAIEFTYQC